MARRLGSAAMLLVVAALAFGCTGEQEPPGHTLTPAEIKAGGGSGQGKIDVPGLASGPADTGNAPTPAGQ